MAVASNTSLQLAARTHTHTRACTASADVYHRHVRCARFEDVERCMQATGVDAVMPSVNTSVLTVGEDRLLMPM